MESTDNRQSDESQQGIGRGVIGCGGFGLFALQHFTQVAGVKLLGMAGTHRPAALAAARRFGVEEVESIEKLVDQNKLHRYGELLRALMEDQIAWIRDRSHTRRMTENNGRDSLALAVAADRLAHA